MNQAEAFDMMEKLLPNLQEFNPESLLEDL